MKLIFVLVLALSLSASASSVAQDMPVSLQVKNASLQEVFSQLSKQTDYSFLCNADMFKDVKVTLNVKNTALKEVLNQFLDPQYFAVSFLDDKTVVIKRKHTVVLKDQAITITGRVVDRDNNPLPGATISIKGTTTSTSADADGRFKISVPDATAVLVVSFVGYTQQEVAVKDNTNITITLADASSQLEQVVVVGYGTQKKSTLTGSVASVKSADLTASPSSSTVNTLSGRLPGLVSQQTSGQPGADQASISIRGFGQAIWIVDGVESDFNNIDPNQIESISILKDGAASIYGARAGNGVVLVTTKRGKEGKPDVTINSSYTLQGNTTMTKPVNSGQYAELTNLFYINQGKPAQYTQEQIDKFYAGNDPAYPNTDWKKVAMRTWAPQTQQNLSVRGGSDKIKYFGFIGYMNQDAIWRNNGGGYKRYNLQSNLDAKINDDLTIQLLLSGVDEAKSQTQRGNGAGVGVWGDLWSSLPIYPATLPDPTKNSYANGLGVGSVLLSSDQDIFGYSKNNTQNYKATFIADYKIRAVEGLSAKAFINYDKTYITLKDFTKPYSFYTYDYSTEKYTLAGSLGTQAKLLYQTTQRRNITSQLSLNYDKVLGRDHHITALALYEMIDYNENYIVAGRDNFLTPAIEELFAGAVQSSQANSSAQEMGRVSYVGRLNYSYKDKYILETSLRADASAKFPANSRWGYFPGAALSWRLSQEEFLKKFSSIDELKLRASFGSSGLDNVGNFQYLTGYQFAGQWLIGNGTQVGIGSTGLPNPLLTWQKIRIYNFGTDFSFWNRKLFGTAEVFYRTLSGIPATRLLSLPNTFGAGLPAENLNSQNNRGFELSLGTAGRVGDLTFEVAANVSWSRAKWVHYEEPVYTDPDQIRLSQFSGRWTDVTFGYRAAGLFTSQQEIDNLAFTYPGGNAGLRPGDVKYIDVNGDGKLDFRDQQQIGTSTVPNWMTGATINLKYKNFDLQSLLQGAFNYYSNTNLSRGSLNYSQAFYRNMWTEENNNANALTPRIAGAATNSLLSDLYFKKASYLRLKTLAIGYTVPVALLSKASIRNLRIYVAGTNLFTINPLRKYDVDPEAPSGQAGYYYPQQRTISFGLNVTL